MLEGRSEVLVIGAGPAGCAAAITLAKAGIDVAVLDQANFPRDKTCGDALSNKAVKLIRELGAGSQLDALSHALVYHSAAVFPGGFRVTREYAEPGWIVPRMALDHMLYETLQASGARLHQGVQVRSLTLDNDQVAQISGDALRWQAPVVIAADGPGSVAWAALGLPKPRGRLLTIASTAYYEGVSFPEGHEVADHYFEHDLSAGYGWIFPSVDGLSNVGIGQRDDAYRRHGHHLPAALDSFIARHPERFANARRVGAVRSWPLPVANRAPFAKHGILLVGDAGGFVDPLSGEGIWQALFTGVQAGLAAIDAARAGVLTREIAERYTNACSAAIAKPSRTKVLIQDAMTCFVACRMYRSRLMRTILQGGYAYGVLEHTKAL